MRRLLFMVAAGLACMPAVAQAGMPGVEYTISEVAKMRLEALSFFVAGFFLAALGVKWLWNHLASEFTMLPRISYGKALGLLTLWGLLFVLVLTMISGARELMTPGAWERDGTTYKLRETPTSPGVIP